MNRNLVVHKTPFSVLLFFRTFNWENYYIYHPSVIPCICIVTELIKKAIPRVGTSGAKLQSVCVWILNPRTHLQKLQNVVLCNLLTILGVLLRSRPAYPWRALPSSVVTSLHNLHYVITCLKQWFSWVTKKDVCSLSSSETLKGEVPQSVAALDFPAALTFRSGTVFRRFPFDSRSHYPLCWMKLLTLLCLSMSVLR